MGDRISVEAGSPAAARVQEAVHSVLVENELSAPDDQVMAEYVTVMIANQKNESMIAEELGELVGGALDAAIPHAIWERASAAAAGRAGPAGAPAPAPAPEAPRAPARDRSASPPARRTGGREGRWEEDQPRKRGKNTRGRYVRAHAGSTDACSEDRAEQPQGRPKEAQSERGREPRPLSIFGRAGIPDPNAAPFTPQNGTADGAANGGAPDGAPSLIARLDPMPENAAPLEPPRDVESFPSAPSESALCRYGTHCTNPLCGYSHPTPANAGRGGDERSLVLSEEACERGGECTDKECVKSHVSPAVAFIKARGSAPPPAPAAGVPCRFQQQCLNPGCTYVHYDAQGRVVPPPGAAPAPSSIPCRFGAGCTRPDCFYVHPARPSGARKTPCRYGDACTRADCFFVHPRDSRKPHTSERLASFAQHRDDDPEREVILPGGAPENREAEPAGGGEATPAS